MTKVLYIFLCALIIWKIYARFISFTLNKIHQELSDNDDSDENGKSDLEPLFRLLGKLLITAVATAAILACFGLNLAAIVTGAGLVTLGVTYGAQQTLNQFFSGVVLLVTRPFKAGDLVSIGSSDKVYRVKSVTVMNTIFDNWTNEEVVVMPNSSVTSSTIVNYTGKNLTYKIHVFMNIAYGEDIDQARRIMLDIAMTHPDVIIDGTVDLPYVRVTNFGDSDIQLRLTVFIHDFEDYGAVGAQLSELIYKEFVARGINIPFPQVDVHLDYVKDGKTE